MIEAGEQLSNMQFTDKQFRMLCALLDRLDFDAASGSLVIRNKRGTARLIFREDGTLRVEGMKIVNVANGAMVLSAATIDCN